MKKDNPIDTTHPGYLTVPNPLIVPPIHALLLQPCTFLCLHDPNHTIMYLLHVCTVLPPRDARTPFVAFFRFPLFVVQKKKTSLLRGVLAHYPFFAGNPESEILPKITILRHQMPFQPITTLHDVNLK